MNGKLAYLVPAHNEQEVIGPTLQALLKLASSEDIYVVNDGSADQTGQAAGQFTGNVLNLYPNQGKATAMNMAIEYFKLVENYQYLMPVDADTIITPNFINNALPVLIGDIEEQVACVVGKVVGRNSSWVTLYRIWEYEVSQSIHKKAQAIENAIIVCPGCATIYRTKIFANHKIPTGTLTEDMDFTFLIHRQNLGRIVYTPQAVVITQDPQTLKDFLKQIDRWYTGFWQCLRKNNIPWGGQMLDFEVSLLASEGIFNGLFSLIMFMIVPLTIITNPAILIVPLGIDLGFFMLPTMVFTARRQHVKRIFPYIFHFYFLRLVSSLVFIKAFFKVVVGIDLSMIWGKAKRYKVSEVI
jgi:biofilm PGA synthesis N-glycosyltransferase PgaC